MIIIAQWLRIMAGAEFEWVRGSKLSTPKINPRVHVGARGIVGPWPFFLVFLT